MDDEDRHLAMVQHVVAHTAQDGASQSAESTRTHDDQVGIDVVDNFDNHVTRLQASFYARDYVRRWHLKQNERSVSFMCSFLILCCVGAVAGQLVQ